MCGKKDDAIPEKLDDAIRWSTHRNELRKEAWKRRGFIALGGVALLAWVLLFAVGFLSREKPEPVNDDVKELLLAVNKVIPNNQAEALKLAEKREKDREGWLVDKETRSQARLAALAAFSAVVGFLIGKKVKGDD